MVSSGMERIEGPGDVELGDEAVAVERPHRAGLVVAIRLSPDEAGLLERLADQRRMSISALAKQMVTASLESAPVTTSATTG